MEEKSQFSLRLLQQQLKELQDVCKISRSSSREPWKLPQNRCHISFPKMRKMSRSNERPRPNRGRFIIYGRGLATESERTVQTTTRRPAWVQIPTRSPLSRCTRLSTTC